MAGIGDQYGQLQGQMDSFLKAASKIETFRNMDSSVINLLNRNDSRQAVATAAPANEILLQRDRGAGWKDIARHVAPSTSYPFTRFGAVKKAAAFDSNCHRIGVGLACDPVRRYLLGDPIWALFDVTTPDLSWLTAPVRREAACSGVVRI